MCSKFDKLRYSPFNDARQVSSYPSNLIFGLIWHTIFQILFKEKDTNQMNAFLSNNWIATTVIHFNFSFDIVYFVFQWKLRHRYKSKQNKTKKLKRRLIFTREFAYKSVRRYKMLDYVGRDGNVTRVYYVIDYVPQTYSIIPHPL